MSRSTISTTLHSTVTLGTDGYASDLTFTSKGGDTPTLYGADAVVVDVAGGIVHNAGVLSGAGNSENGAGGIGIHLAASGTVNNSGTVSGGYGSSGYVFEHVGHPGSVGGAGIVLAHGGVITNSGDIVGGSGGGPADGAGGYAYCNGGNGGAGVVMAGGTLSNQATIEGGDGNYGGAGGAGISVSKAGTVVNSGLIEGGLVVLYFTAEPAGTVRLSPQRVGSQITV
jgi:hypothetical protein